MVIEARDDVVSLSGSLEKNLWPAIQAAANLLLRMHPNGILIDASGITKCSEEGAITFLSAMEYIERHHARIMVCHPPESVEQTLKHVPGVRSRLAIADTCEQGRTSLELASNIRRSSPAHAHFDVEGDAAGKSRLVIVPLTAESKNLTELIGTALQIGGVELRGDTGDEENCGPGVRRERIAPLLHFLFVIEVPRSMPLNSPMTEEETTARGIIDRATQIAETAGVVSQSSVARTRDAGEEIAAQAATLGCDAVVITLPPPRDPLRERIEPMVDSVMRNARCQVLLKNWPA